MRITNCPAMVGAFLAVLFIKTTPATATCWWVGAEWNPKTEEWQCMPYTCAFWCCKICLKD